MNSDVSAQCLKVSNRDRKNQLFREGFDHGKEWAENNAKPTQLRRLAKIFDGSTPVDSTDQLVIEWLMPDYGEGLDVFWEEAIGDPYDARPLDNWFLVGFVEGALATWRASKPRR